MSILGGFLSPGLTAATALANGAQTGQISADRELTKRAIEARQMEHQQTMEQLTALLNAAKIGNYGSLSETRENGVTYKPDGSGNMVGLRKVVPTGDPLSPPALAIPTGVTAPKPKTVTRVEERPDGSRVQVEQQPDGTWKESAMSGDGGSLTLPSPTDAAAINADSTKSAHRQQIRVDNPLPVRAPYSATDAGAVAKEKQAHLSFVLQRIKTYRAPHTNPLTFQTTPGLSPEAAAEAAAKDARASGQFPHIYKTGAPATGSSNPFMQ